ncbi:hypothetical protein Tsubulata_047761 [Turnera subulata]|uniref:CCHC-type domain-containing protein n=1 Tax=Turnera subulata TaxID=218843 RepID=A0A9Q0JMR7_9ROSI|nr:hypothetical protein Tsubulata_047761 [Turnera subulata]
MATSSVAPGGPPRPPDPSSGFSAGLGARPSFKDKLVQWRTGVSTYRADDGFQLAPDDIRVLPVEWYRQDILNALALQIGKPIRIDINTLHAERAKFARLAIEVEFTKPLLGRVEIEGRWFEVCYEDIPDFCFLCGMVGHMVSTCPKARAEQRPTPPQHDAEVPLEQVVATVRPMEAPAKPDTSKFGSWMRVSRQPRGTANRNVSKGPAIKIAANPFDLGSATALLNEVMRDAADVPSSSTTAPAGSVVFSAPLYSRYHLSLRGSLLAIRRSLHLGRERYWGRLPRRILQRFLWWRMVRGRSVMMLLIWISLSKLSLTLGACKTRGSCCRCV